MTTNIDRGDRTQDNPILDKIRKLLAKAENPACTPAEAEAFTGKAAELIAKYGIDTALLAATTPTRDPVGDRIVILHPPYARDKGGLLATIAFGLRCKVVQRRDWVDGQKQLAMHLFGHASDLERVDLLYTSLLVQAAHVLAVQYVPPWESVVAYRRSWYAGYATAIGRRLDAAERRAQHDAQTATAGTGPSVALVLADRTALVEQAVHQRYPRLRASRTRHLTGNGQRDGYSAGQRADLGGTRLTQTGRRRLDGGHQ